MANERVVKVSYRAYRQLVAKSSRESIKCSRKVSILEIVDEMLFGNKKEAAKK